MVAGVGAITLTKTLVVAGVDKDVSVQQVAYYFGATVIALCVAAAVGGACAAGTLTVGDFLAGTGEDRAPLVVEVIAIAVGLLVSIGVFVPLVAVHVLFDDDETYSFGRGFVAFLGIIAAGITIVVYKLASTEVREAREAEARGEIG